MKKFTTFVTTMFLLCFVSSSLAALSAPVVSTSTDGLDITIDWTSVSGATGYTLYYAPVTDSGYGTISSKDMGASSAFNYTLWDGAAFYIAVKAYNDQESSPYSNIGTLTIPYTTAPESPQLSANLDGTTLSATWGSVSGATGYTLYYTLSAYTGQEAFLPLDVGNQTSFSYTGLSEGQTYSIAVVAYNDFGESDFSNVAQLTVEVAPPSTPSIVGTWYINEYTGPNSCGDPQPYLWDSYTVTIQESGQISALYGHTFYGTINGNTISATSDFSFYEDEGTTTVTFASMTSTDSETLEGYDKWTWTDGYESCSGTNTYYGTRTN